MLTTSLIFPPIQTINAWKFPGGLSNPGEDIGKSYENRSAIN